MGPSDSNYNYEYFQTLKTGSFHPNTQDPKALKKNKEQDELLTFLQSWRKTEMPEENEGEIDDRLHFFAIPDQKSALLTQN